MYMYIFTSRLGFLFCYFYFPLFLFSFCFLTISFDLSFRSLCHTACNTMISIDLWRARIGLHSNRYRFSKISCCFTWCLMNKRSKTYRCTSIKGNRLYITTALAFSTILACVISILLIIVKEGFPRNASRDLGWWDQGWSRCRQWWVG